MAWATKEPLIDEEDVFLGSSPNVTDDYECNYTVTGNSTMWSLHGSVTLRLTCEADAKSSLFLPCSGELLIHDGGYPSENSKRYWLQGVYLLQEQVAVVVAHEANYFAIQAMSNLRVKVPVHNGTRLLSQEVLSQLARLPGNVTADDSCVLLGWFFFASSLDSAEPPWRRPLSSDRGQASPFVQMNGRLASPGCGGHMLIQGRSVFARGEALVSRLAATVYLAMLAPVILALAAQLRAARSPRLAARMAPISIFLSVFGSACLFVFALLAALLQPLAALPLLFLAAVSAAVFFLAELPLLLAAVRARPHLESILAGVGENGRLRWSVTLATVLILGLLSVAPRFAGALFLAALSSMWLPQIISNIRSDSAASLTPSFIIWVSLQQLLPLVYICVFDNAFRMPPHPLIGVIVILWMAAQVFLLFAQLSFGPRVLIAPCLPVTVPGFDYCQPLSDAQRDEPCLICMVPLSNVEIDEASYMLTPCGHVFHSSCLLNWFDYKLQCPTCRRDLPVS